MSGAAWLLAYALTMSLLGGRALSGLTSSGLSPRLSILAWQLASWSVLLSVSAAAFLVAVPSLGPMYDLAGLLRICWGALHAMASGSSAAPVRRLALVVAVAVPLRYGSCLLLAAARIRARRRRHGEMVQLVASHDASLGASILPGDSPLAYCLPGRRARIVISRGALEALSDAQVQAVIGHERGHLQGRHHIAVLAAQSLARSFPKVPLFVSAASGIRQLIELCADDVAVRTHGRLTLAQALLALSGAGIPTGELGGAGEATALRIDRLLDSAGNKSCRRTRWTLRLAVLALGLGPGLALAMPVALEGWHLLASCPLPALV